MTDEVLEFFAKHSSPGAIVYSTSATVVNIPEDVFNVRGSSGDPKIGGKSWKQLLKDNGLYGPCYVTNPILTAQKRKARAVLIIKTAQRPARQAQLLSDGESQAMPDISTVIMRA